MAQIQTTWIKLEREEKTAQVRGFLDIGRRLVRGLNIMIYSDNIRNVWIIGYPVVAYTSNGGRDTLSEDERLAIQYDFSSFLGEELR